MGEGKFLGTCCPPPFSFCADWNSRVSWKSKNQATDLLQINTHILSQVLRPKIPAIPPTLMPSSGPFSLKRLLYPSTSVQNKSVGSEAKWERKNQVKDEQKAKIHPLPQICGWRCHPVVQHCCLACAPPFLSSCFLLHLLHRKKTAGSAVRMRTKLTTS